MTHFTVGIIVPENELPHIDSFIERQMEPYCEHTEVEPYVCYSIDRAKAEIERDIHRFEQILERQDPAFDLDKCRESVARLRRTTPEDRYREYVAGAEEFNAQGEPLSTYNPDSKWDWYRIGGRWDGCITGNEQSSDQGFNFGPGHETLANNIATTEQAIERDIVLHAIVTPDGQWHERGQMGWWAIMITDNEDWDAQARELLSSYPGHHVVLLDAHI